MPSTGSRSIVDPPPVYPQTGLHPSTQAAKVSLMHLTHIHARLKPAVSGKAAYHGQQLHVTCQTRHLHLAPINRLPPSAPRAAPVRRRLAIVLSNSSTYSSSWLSCLRGPG